jgi:hypothetical protein
MDPRSDRAETLPELYRAVLAAATELDRRGDRRAGGRVRARAARAYADWDEAAQHRLERLLEDARERAHRRPQRPSIATRLGELGRRGVTTTG